MNKSVKEFLRENTLLFDGGMGTYYSARCRDWETPCEFANLSEPELISEMHREYVAAGAQALKTNTFAANPDACHGDAALLERLIAAGWSLAAQAAGTEAYVFADIGPVLGKSMGETLADYCQIADAFLALGAENFLFETNSDDLALEETARYIKQLRPGAFILTSFAAQPGGFTAEGRGAEELLRRMAECGYVDAVGLNCATGARHIRELLSGLPELPVPLSAMPNAGYPAVIDRRTVYEGDPQYFAEQVAEMAATRARIVGGCCGTTPVHIAAVRAALSRRQPTADKATYAPAVAGRPAQLQTENELLDKLRAGKRVIAVELDPPKTADSASFMDGARRLQAAGIDVMTIADCPIARACMDSSLLACKVRRELGLQVIPHMTCRDRNLNATKALLLGLFSEGIRNVLTVTGDPVPTAERDEVKSVYQFNSRKMARYIRDLGQTELPAPMQVFGALNLNVRNFDVQLKLAKEKSENGVVGFLTQPVLTPEAFENLKRAHAELQGWILGGILPVVSAKNARFMDSEISGINVSPELIALYEGKNREEGEALALDVSVEIAKRIASYVDGYYLMTPFHRVALMERLVERLKVQL